MHEQESTARESVIWSLENFTRNLRIVCMEVVEYIK